MPVTRTVIFILNNPRALNNYNKIIIKNIKITSEEGLKINNLMISHKVHGSPIDLNNQQILKTFNEINKERWKWAD